ncbi:MULTISPECIES: hypothetical protein [unclassified Leptospira]|uniref:hypothetical protein n=1 Tax=unclassified Leptospira TaxID=2633828 RepID=UPI0002BECA59|nr:MULTISPECIES: hypothetical protein [unclassified Leptospira]EMJ99572.1 hypothetical protein LEP1GSC192_0460 [Leptospira sp. B5-022]MCR1795837.1 hypothetical protein [Leptospira sp. id769339]
MQIEKIREEMKGLRNRKVAHPELGPLNDFEEVDTQKEVIFDFIESCLSEHELYTESLSKQLSQNTLATLGNCVQTVKTYLDQVDQLVSNGIHKPEFPGTRQNILNWFITKSIFTDQKIINFQVQVLYAKIKSDAFLKDISEGKKHAIREIGKLSKSVKEAEKILGNLQDKISTKVISETESTFNNLQFQHEKYESRWFLSFAISLTFCLMLVGYSVFCVSLADDAKVGTIIKYLLERSFLILFPTLIAKISLTKYQTERHLNVLYAHRAAVLSQYKEFENAIGDSAPDKNQFRLEIAKYLFSDPQTGYLKETGSGDLNVNPIISIMEKINTNKS